jgi:hypothetical protein
VNLWKNKFIPNQIPSAGLLDGQDLLQQLHPSKNNKKQSTTAMLTALNGMLTMVKSQVQQHVQQLGTTPLQLTVDDQGNPIDCSL